VGFIDCEVCLSVYDLGGILLSMGHHSRTVIIGDLPIAELNNSNDTAVVIILA
jgi:hypothetical protein